MNEVFMRKCGGLKDSVISKLSVTLILLILFSGLTSIYSQQMERPIGSITVKGNQRTSDEYIKNVSGLTVGRNFSTRLSEKAVRSLYSLNMIGDVSIEATPTDGKLEVVIHVDELPVVKKVEFEGNAKFDAKKLKNIISIEKGSYLAPRKVKQAVSKIEDKYLKKGYSRVQVKSEPYTSSSGKIILAFKINEGRKVNIKKISFSGNKHISDGDLRGAMKLNEKSLIGLLHSGKFDKEKYAKDKERIVDYYKNNGFINAEVVSDSFSYGSGGNMHIHIKVEEGQKYYFSDVNIKGHEAISKNSIRGALQFEPGDVFSQKEYNKSLESIYALYQEKGFLFLNIRDNYQLEGDSVDVSLAIEEGQPAEVREIKIVGNTRTFEKVIRRELDIYPGEIFRRSKLKRSQRNVYFLNYFKKVRPNFEVIDSQRVRLVFNVEPKQIGKFQIGAGYNSRDKLVGTASVGWPNVLGRGWKVKLNYEFGKERQNFNLNFTVPWFMGTPTTVGFDLYNSVWRWSNYYSQEKRGGAIRLGRDLFFPDDYTRVSTRYSYERLEYFDFSDHYNPTRAYDLREVDWPQYRSALKLGLSRDSRNSSVFATKGNKNSYSIEFAGEVLGGNEDYQLQHVHSNWYFKMWEYLVFVMKNQGHFLTNWWGEPGDVPRGERFYPGGVSVDGQIRGYTDRSVSPIDYKSRRRNTEVTPDIGGNYPLSHGRIPYKMGGRSVVIFSPQLRVPIKRDRFYMSVFSDIGNAWADPSDIAVNDFKTSLGVGARLMAPMLGIIGFDVAYGFQNTSPYNDEPAGWNFHFQLGPGGRR